MGMLAQGAMNSHATTKQVGAAEVATIEAAMDEFMDQTCSAFGGANMCGGGTSSVNDEETLTDPLLLKQHDAEKAALSTVDEATAVSSTNGDDAGSKFSI